MSTLIAYTIPALVVLLTSISMLALCLRAEDKKRRYELQRMAQKELIPVRLHAYERLALLLERTQPEAMVMNEASAAHRMAQDSTGTYSVQDLQRELLKTVRMEFDHNMSQQIYVSDEVWDHIILARDEMGGFINTIAIQMKPGSTAMDYTKALLSAYVSNGDTPHQKAQAMLRMECQQLFG